MSSTNPTCAFCEIVAGRSPAHIVGENDLAIALLDINPFTEGHCLVVSKRHVPWWHDLTDEETVSVFLLAKRVGVTAGARRTQATARARSRRREDRVGTAFVSCPESFLYMNYIERCAKSPG